MKFPQNLICFMVWAMMAPICAQSGGAFQITIGSPDSSEYVTCFTLDDSNNIYLSTMVFHRKERQQRLKLHKISRTGKIEWSKDYPEKSMTILCLIRQQDGTFIMAGSIKDTLDNKTIESRSVLLKADPLGNLVWQKTFKFGDRGSVFEIYPTTGGYIFKASAYTDIPRSAGQQHIFLCKTDMEGTIIWEKDFAISPDGYGTMSITPLKNGNFLCTLEDGLSETGFPTRMFTLTPEGVIMEEKQFPVKGIYAVVEKENGEFLVFQMDKPESDEDQKKYALYIRKLTGDSLPVMTRVPEKYNYRGPQLVSGYFYAPTRTDHDLKIAKMTPEFNLIDEGSIEMADDMSPDCIYITDKNEVLITAVLKTPLTDDPKHRYNYDIVVKKVTLDHLFKN